MKYKNLIFLFSFCLFISCERGWLNKILYPPGCTDEIACNYDMSASKDDGSCLYLDCNDDCGGASVFDQCGVCDDDDSNNCTQDCLGIWGGNASQDCEGVCDGPAIEDCNGICNGSAVLDQCGICDDDDSNNCTQDCLGIWGGNASQDCEGVCDGPAIEDCNGICNGTDIQDCLGICGGVADFDACGICNGQITNPIECPEQGYSLSLSNVILSSGSLDILMNNEAAIAGFQFGIDGIDISGASGGTSEDAGFEVSTSSSTVLGFTLTGNTIAPSNNILTTITFNSSSDEICLYDVILSDPLGIAVDVEVGGCFDGFGCTDASACNYDPSASVDDGSCAYELDCLGECDGSALIDDCGVCNGNNADQDCLGICFGDAEFDCAGECNGDALEDVCGECNGPGYYTCNDGTQVCNLENCPDPCTGINCPDYCSGNYLYYNGNCINGSCNYSNTYCSNGCSNNQCNTQSSDDCNNNYYCSDCAGCESNCCPNFCSGNYYYYNNTCDSQGFCSWGPANGQQYCPNGCNSNGCIDNDPCQGVNCSSFCSNGIYYFNGTCTDSGNCNYSTYVCPNGCNWQATSCND